MSDDKIPKDHADELAECFDTYAPGLFGHACVITRGDRALAEDLVQSTFVAAARQWPTLRELVDPQRMVWLRTTIENLAVSTFRRNESFRSRLAQVEVLYRPLAADTHMEALCAAALERCWQTILDLPSQQHAVAVMRWLLGMKNFEIVAALGLASGTVSAHLAAVRRKLRANLGPFDPFAADDADDLEECEDRGNLEGTQGPEDPQGPENGGSGVKGEYGAEHPEAAQPAKDVGDAETGAPS